MTLITTPFGFTSTAAEVSAGIDLTGRRAIVTGGASGIGTETVRALARIGANVTVAVRNVDAAKAVIAEIVTATGNPEIRALRLDLADRATIAAFVDAWEGPLHLLVNNAGIMALPALERTAEGFEMQFATNHLGHFALALGLQRALAAAGNARIVAL
ncbi:MAG: SDR family NAD(P)-dependent oxidoreductase, partial [Gemmatimonadaceae bacterium]|nr:SDR family NAD(P)-dependent oxidoreductase [Gemmatimonadaceae bacterium]